MARKWLSLDFKLSVSDLPQVIHLSSHRLLPQRPEL